jgi:hypothetical protein
VPFPITHDMFGMLIGVLPNKYRHSTASEADSETTTIVRVPQGLFVTTVYV